MEQTDPEPTKNPNTADDALVLIVNGRVRRGILVPGGDIPCENENCGRDSAWVLVSPKGRMTWVCAECLVLCGPPMPPVQSGREWRTVAELRTACALGSAAASPTFWREVEQYEADLKRWERATRKHGFRRVQADPRKRNNVALWMPYADTQGGGK